jgi:MYXO-CTERM domain-containing protein
MNKRILGAALAAIGCGVSLSAQAAVTWTFDVPPPGTAPCVQSAVAFGNNVTCTTSVGGAPTVVATAWSNTTGIVSGNTSNATLNTAQVNVYPNTGVTGSTVGLGVTNRGTTTTDPGEGGSPEHAIDNNGTGSTGTTVTKDKAVYDSILLTFSSAVSLTGITIGWVSTDSDVSVAAYLGAGNGGATLAGKTYAQLAAAGWSYVEHESNLASNTQRLINGATGTADTTSAATVTSKYWLVSAYNPTLNNDSSLTVGNDYFKLLSVAAAVTTPPAPSGTPEPAGLALVAVAALGASAAVRRRNKAAA